MLDFNGGRQARLRYLPGSFDVLTPGDYVTCAVSGKRVTLTALRYWSAELQEAYASADIAVKRYTEMRAKGRL
ncbi:DUF2093 domain-containing protein [Glacieibacterium sp.]|uniref:DUF2093 domain-containing protein n=1 Tax=Glacieibacterium sp. TaxID=2860237 RepID=UPI003B0081E5